ncbi:hypothetical protein TOTORO_02680 [Serratia phage vB_SmaS-Totoro]|nr:hypothetical protein TOTORO_02680 [Serratia phage vB_SmaS-Totoro]
MNQREIIEITIDVVRNEARRNFICDFLDSEMGREGYRGSLSEKAFRFVVDATEMELTRSRKRIDDIIYDMVLRFGAAQIAKDRSLTRQLNEDEMDDVIGLEKEAMEIGEDLADYNDRSNSRDRDYDRRGGGRRESSFSRDSRSSMGSRDRFGGGRRDNFRSDYSTGGRSQRDVRDDREDHRREDRRTRQDSRNGRTPLDNNEFVPESPAGVISGTEAMARLHLEKRRLMEEARQEKQQARQTRQSQREPVQERRPVDSVRRNHTQTFERVAPADITSKPQWSADPEGPCANNADFVPDDIGQWGVSAKGNILPSPERPLTQYEIMNKCYDFNDSEVVEAVPERPRFTVNGAAASWEADEVAPQWGVNKDGYRILTFRKLSEEEKEKVRKEIHVMPDILGVRNGPGKVHPQREEILLAAGKTTRFNLEEAKRREAESRKMWEDEVTRLKAENENLPEEEQQELPEFVEADFTPNIDETVKVGKILRGVGHDGLNVEILKARKEIGENGLDIRAENFKVIHDAGDIVNAQDLIGGLRGLVITSSPVSSVTVSQMVRSLENRQAQLPSEVIVYAKRHIVNVVNEILTLEMGTSLTIDSVDDLPTIEQDLVKMVSPAFAEKFSETLARNVRRFEIFTTGEAIGMDSCIVTKVTSGVLTLPICQSDLGMRKRPGIKVASATVSKESSPKLYAALNMMAMVHPDMEKELHLLDGTWVKVNKDLMTEGQFVLSYKLN